MKKIQLSGKHGKGKFTMVDDEDAARLEEMGVSLSLTTRYAQFRYKGKVWKLHRFIMKVKKGEFVDHIDGNGLNNCKSNLRFCTLSENQANKSSPKGTSKYKGISFIKKTKKWRADIRKNYKQIYLGTFETETDAALAYNAKAKELFGEFAYLNQIKDEKPNA